MLWQNTWGACCNPQPWQTPASVLQQWTNPPIHWVASRSLQDTSLVSQWRTDLQAMWHILCNVYRAGNLLWLVNSAIQLPHRNTHPGQLMHTNGCNTQDSSLMYTIKAKEAQHTWRYAIRACVVLSVSCFWHQCLHKQTPVTLASKQSALLTKPMPHVNFEFYQICLTTACQLSLTRWLHGNVIAGATCRHRQLCSQQCTIILAGWLVQYATQEVDQTSDRQYCKIGQTCKHTCKSRTLPSGAKTCEQCLSINVASLSLKAERKCFMTRVSTPACCTVSGKGCMTSPTTKLTRSSAFWIPFAPNIAGKSTL